MAQVHYDRQSEVYDRGRTFPAETFAAWMSAAQRAVPDPVDRILDLGSGTGRFSAALAASFEANVIAIDPSEGMRRQAVAKLDPRVHVIGGVAEYLSLRDASCELAWLSNVITTLPIWMPLRASYAESSRKAGLC